LISYFSAGLYRTAILRADLNLYRYMLKELRKDELRAGAINSVTFLIDAFDVQVRKFVKNI